MKNDNLKNIWESYSSSLHNNLNINLNQLQEKNVKKTRNALNGLLLRRTIESMLFLLFAVLLLKFSIENTSTIHYLFSGLILMTFCLIGLIGSILQIVLIFRLDYSQPITSFQTQLEKLKIYSLQTLRLIFLSIPFYITYMIIGFKVLYDFDIFSNADSSWFLWNLALAILFIPLTLWLVKILNYKTRTKWVQKLIIDNGGKQIHSAIQFLNEIEEFEKNGKTNH